MGYYLLDMNKITIAVNARMLQINRLDGIGQFAFQTLTRLITEHPEVNFVLLFDHPGKAGIITNNNVQSITLPPPTGHPICNFIWFQFSIKKYLNRLNPDLFLSPDGLLSLKVNCSQLAVIHDLNFVHQPKDLPLLLSLYFNRYYRLSAKTAARIATVSQFSKQDIVNTYQIDPGRIDVVYNGVDSSFKQINGDLKQQVRNKFSSGSEYFIFVGSIHPRKNIGRLLQAFEHFKTQTNSPLKLVIVGAIFWRMKELTEILNRMRFKKDVIFTGRLNDSDLRNIIAAAFCLTFVPYFEGFGMPVVEAMSSGVPVIASNTTATPEIGGSAAHYFDPFNTADIAKALLKITADDQYRNDLISQGLIQRRKFTWEKSADRLWKSIQRTLL
jgi:glycosyltransferase involved in cell wall biosynthesis